MAQRGWISEKYYNKSRGGDCSKVLVGNWQEEQVLEGDMVSMGCSLDTTRKKEGTSRVVGGFESTAFLISSEAPDKRTTELLTTQKASYNNEFGDVTKLRKPGLGVRSQVRAEAIVEQARRDHAATIKAKEDATIPEAVSSTYRETVGGDKRPKRAIGGFDNSYMNSKPITLYTPNPVSGKQMTVHGVTPVSNDNIAHGKNTNFTNPKYVL